jgi:hypothetical protein
MGSMSPREWADTIGAAQNLGMLPKDVLMSGLASDATLMRGLANATEIAMRADVSGAGGGEERKGFSLIGTGTDKKTGEKYFEYQPKNLHVKSIRYYPGEAGKPENERIEFEPDQPNKPIGKISLGATRFTATTYNQYQSQDDLPLEKGTYHADGRFKFQFANAGVVEQTDRSTGKTEGKLLFGDNKSGKCEVSGKVVQNSDHTIEATDIKNLWGYTSGGSASRPIVGFKFTSQENGRSQFTLTPVTQGVSSTGPESPRVRHPEQGAEEFKGLRSGISVCEDEFRELREHHTRTNQTTRF